MRWTARKLSPCRCRGAALAQGSGAYGGHGIGRKLHESPHINNYGPPGKGPRLKPGHVFCIEPILCLGDPEVEHFDDGWTTLTRDRSLAAHSEHTVAITEDGPQILTLPDTVLA